MWVFASLLSSFLFFFRTLFASLIYLVHSAPRSVFSSRYFFYRVHAASPASLLLLVLCHQTQHGSCSSFSVDSEWQQVAPCSVSLADGSYRRNVLAAPTWRPYRKHVRDKWRLVEDDRKESSGQSAAPSCLFKRILELTSSFPFFQFVSTPQSTLSSLVWIADAMQMGTNISLLSKNTHIVELNL